MSELQRGPGRLDVLVNTAGIIVEAEPTKTTATELRPVFETNLSAPSR